MQFVRSSRYYVLFFGKLRPAKIILRKTIRSMFTTYLKKSKFLNTQIATQRRAKKTEMCSIKAVKRGIDYAKLKETSDYVLLNVFNV